VTFQPSHRRTVVIFLCGLILFGLVRQANHALSPYALSLWLGGLFVGFPALRLAPQQGFNACFLLGLMVDAASALPFGLNAFLFCTAHLIIVRIRSRFAAEEPLIATIVAMITNLVLFLIVTFVAISRAADAPISGLRFLIDLFLSQIAIALLAPWFFALQERALTFSRIGLGDEPATLA
jgi:rod shape-determining protein MreD